MLTLDHLRQIMRHASHARLAEYLPPLNDVMARFDIHTVGRAAAFLAQLVHESGEFRFMEELWGPTEAQKRHEPQSSLARRLGNTKPGDGKRFKGRGPIQITGRDNCKRYGAPMQRDLVAEPQLAATPQVGFTTAALFGQKNGLNALADAGDFRAITQRINGNQNGAAERERFCRRALEVLRDDFSAQAAPDAERPEVPAEEFPRNAEAVRQKQGEAPAPGAKKPRRKARTAGPARVLNARPDTMDFRDVMYVPMLLEVPTQTRRVESRYRLSPSRLPTRTQLCIKEIEEQPNIDAYPQTAALNATFRPWSLFNRHEGGADKFLDYLEGSSCIHTRTGFEPYGSTSSWASGSA